MEKTQTTTFSG